MMINAFKHNIALLLYFIKTGKVVFQKIVMANDVYG